MVSTQSRSRTCWADLLSAGGEGTLPTVTLFQTRGAVLQSLRTQFRARVLEILVRDVADDSVARIALASHDTQIDPRLDEFLLDTANGIAQAFADDGEVDETPDDPMRVH